MNKKMLNLDNIKKIGKNTGFFRFKKFDADSYLITNDIGRYCFLTKEQFGEFLSGKVKDEDKYGELVLKRFIKDEKYQKDMTLAYARKNKFLSYGPSLHIIVVTLRCNHACRYCHAGVVCSDKNNSMDMDEETAKKVIDTIFHTSSPSLTIEFQGGEPLLNWDIVKFIIDYSRTKAFHLKKNLKFALVTNLTLMTQDKLDYLIQNNIGISTSLDGNKEVHDYNRTFLQDGSSFDLVSSWIKKINNFYKEKNIPTKIGALLTATKKVLPNYKEVIDTYLDLDLDSIFLRMLNPYGFAEKSGDLISYTPEEFIDFYIKSMDYILEINKKGTIFKESLTSIYLQKILTVDDPNFLDLRSPCGAGIGQVAYNYDGKIYTCDEGRMLARMGDESFLMASVSDNPGETYKNMIDSQATKTLVQASTIDGLPGYNDHVYKVYLGVCPIYSYKVGGSIFPNFAKDDKKKIDVTVLDYIFEKLQEEENRKIFESWLGIKSK